MPDILLERGRDRRSTTQPAPYGEHSGLMNAVLLSAFEAIRRERGTGFSESFGEAGKVLASFGEADLAERLLAETPAEIPWQDIADLLGILTWSTSDNGSEIARTADGWLEDLRDERRIMVALNLEAYPFRERLEMERVLGRVSEAVPAARDRCLELIASRRKIKE